MVEHCLFRLVSQAGIPSLCVEILCSLYILLQILVQYHHIHFQIHYIYIVLITGVGKTSMHDAIQLISKKTN